MPVSLALWTIVFCWNNLTGLGSSDHPFLREVQCDKPGIGKTFLQRVLKTISGPKMLSPTSPKRDLIIISASPRNGILLKLVNQESPWRGNLPPGPLKKSDLARAESPFAGMICLSRSLLLMNVVILCGFSELLSKGCCLTHELSNKVKKIFKFYSAEFRFLTKAS